MARVQYFTACTLDGFIADELNSLDWLFEAARDDADDGGWEEFIAGVGPMVMGATTYRWAYDNHDIATNPGQWREWYDDRPCWVFTHHALPSVDGSDIRFVSGDVRAAYEEMASTVPGKNIWLVGGGDLVGQFDDAGLLDEVWLGMRPVFLGAGAQVLPRRITSQRLAIREVRHTGQALRIILDVTRRR